MNIFEVDNQVNNNNCECTCKNKIKMSEEDFVIFGIRVAELEKDKKITFTQDMTYEELTELAEEFYKDFCEHGDNEEYFSEYVCYALIKKDESFYKYYVEVWFNSREDGEYPYLMQSQWYSTKKECYDFINSFDYVDSDLRFSLMKARFENEEYGDIECIEEDMVKEKNNNGHN